MSASASPSLRLDRENLYFGRGEATPFVEREKVLCHCGAVAHYIASNKKGYCAKHKAAAYAITRKRSFLTTPHKITTERGTNSCWLEPASVCVTVHSGRSPRETVDGNE